MDLLRKESLSGLSVRLATALTALFAGVSAGAQTNIPLPTPQFEEIVVAFSVPRLIEKDIFVQYDGQTVYLPLTELFGHLDFKIETRLGDRKISGQIATPDQKFEIDLTKFEAKVGGATRPLLPSEYYLGTFDLYLRVDVFKPLFGLEMQFDFSQLKVSLPLNEDFPAFQRLKRKEARDKLRRKKIVHRRVKDLPFDREYIGGAVIDWTLSASPTGGGAHYANITGGALALGGDLSVTLGGNTRMGLDKNQTRYLWHYFYGQSQYFTQADVGLIYTGGSLSRSLRGITVTNEPQVQRKYFQTTNIAGHLGEGWEVELYVDNRLTDFAYTDRHGEYNFNVDVYYGATLVELKMFGPNGEVRSEERYFRAPYRLIPAQTLDYRVSGGLSMDGKDLPYAHSGLGYGVMDFLTVGVSADIPLTPDSAESPIAAFDATILPIGEMTLSGSFAPGYMIEGNASYSKPSLITVSAGFSKFNVDSHRNRLHQLSGIRVSVSSPLKLFGRSLGLRYFVSRDSYQSIKLTNMNYGLNIGFWKTFLNYIGKYKRSESNDITLQDISSQALISLQVVPWFRPQVRIDYDHSAGQISKYGVYLHRRIFRTGQISLSWERNEFANLNQINVSLSFFNRVAHSATRAIVSDRFVGVTQTLRGSARWDHHSKSVRLDRRNSVGYGMAVLRPFRDDNFNGRYDKSEELLPSLKAKLNGATGKPGGGDGRYYFDRLRPYDDYLVEIDPYSLDNPLLKASEDNYRIKLNPNIVTSIDIPVVIAGEITGSVMRITERGQIGVGGITVRLLNLTNEIISEVLTFNNGEFYYLGLLPGHYRAYLDPVQLDKGGWISQPESIEFEVEQVEGGAVVEGVSFSLKAKAR